MTKYLTIAEANQNLLKLSSELGDEPAIITEDGKPIMVAFSYEQIASLLETLEILEDEELSSILPEAITQDKAGQRISWSDAQKQLGWE
ncbi:MAG: type II toxin-antitoxin system Phd/YefM family antitoxin [Crocosphaera sp.]|jgi:antitoxin YefM